MRRKFNSLLNPALRREQTLTIRDLPPSLDTVISLLLCFAAGVQQERSPAALEIIQNLLETSKHHGAQMAERAHREWDMVHEAYRENTRSSCCIETVQITHIKSLFWLLWNWNPVLDITVCRNENRLHFSGEMIRQFISWMIDRNCIVSDFNN